MDIQTRRLRTIGQLRAFVEGNEAVCFQPQDRDQIYGFVRETLVRFDYARLGKRDKGVVLTFLVTVTSVSRQQMERIPMTTPWSRVRTPTWSASGSVTTIFRSISHLRCEVVRRVNAERRELFRYIGDACYQRSEVALISPV